MSEIDYTFRHDDFNITRAYYYTLVLNISSKEFTYAVFYETRLMALAADRSLKELVESTDIAGELFANFKDVVVGVDADAFILVPIELYQQDRVTEYAIFLDVNADERVFAQQLDAENMIVYKTTKQVATAIEQFDYNRCVYNSKGWINAVAKHSTPDKIIYIDFADKQAEMLYLSDGKIRLYNRFDFSTVDDLVYSVSLVFRESGVDQKDVQLRLSGSTAQFNTYASRLAEFFPTVETNTLKLAELPEEFNSGQLLKLSALLLCVSSEAR